MSQDQLLPVSFYGDSLFIASHKNEPFAPMKPIVESMGLTWPSQQQKLTNNKERWGITILVIPTSSGNQDMLCMPVRKLPAYFSTISPNKVAPALREKIILYQNECDDVLWRYWAGQQVKPKPKALPKPKQLALPAAPQEERPSSASLRNEIDEIIIRLKHISMHIIPVGKARSNVMLKATNSLIEATLQMAAAESQQLTAVRDILDSLE